MQLLAARERKLELGAALLVEIQLERHQRHSLPLDRAHELVDLAAVKEELAHAFGRMIEAAALQIFRDVGIDQPDLPAARVGIGFGDRRLAAAQRFHFRAGERDAGLEGLANLVIEARFAVLGDDSNLAVRLRDHLRTFDCHKSGKPDCGVKPAVRRETPPLPLAASLGWLLWRRSGHGAGSCATFRSRSSAGRWQAAAADTVLFLCFEPLDYRRDKESPDRVPGLRESIGKDTARQPEVVTAIHPR